MRGIKAVFLMVATLFGVSACAESERVPTPEFETLKCLGTEPFWAVDHADGQLTYRDIDDQTAAFELAKVLRSANHTNRWLLQGKDAENGEASLALTKTNQCSDGMSEFSYAYDVIVTLPGDKVFSGCCNRLAHD